MKITIGEIVKAQGLRGEVKIRPMTDDLVRFGRLTSVMVGGIPFRLRSANVRGDFVYLSFYGVDDRNAAEVLVGKSIEIDRSQAKKLEEGEYFAVDLIGCKVYLSDGEYLGVLERIDNFGSADIFTVKGTKTVRFPFLSRLGLRYEAEAKKITIEKDRFEEVCCYED